MATESKPGISPASSMQSDGGLVKFVDTLLAIGTDTPLATLNATSISDNNGGRIEL